MPSPWVAASRLQIRRALEVRRQTRARPRRRPICLPRLKNKARKTPVATWRTCAPGATPGVVRRHCGGLPIWGISGQTICPLSARSPEMALLVTGVPSFQLTAQKQANNSARPHNGKISGSSSGCARTLNIEKPNALNLHVLRICEPP